MAQEFHIEFAPRTAVHVENAEPLGEVQVLVERVAGAPTQEQINIAVAEYIEEHPGAAFGISEEVKQALLACFQNIAWKDTDGQSYYDALYNALYPPVAVVSISAVFNPGSDIIYTTDTLESLKQYLTVTATYEDTTTEVITSGYTLSGTLEEGENTITVLYGGKTTTFTVTAVVWSTAPVIVSNNRVLSKDPPSLKSATGFGVTKWYDYYFSQETLENCNYWDATNQYMSMNGWAGIAVCTPDYETYQLGYSWPASSNYKHGAGLDSVYRSQYSISRNTQGTMSFTRYSLAQVANNCVAFSIPLADMDYCYAYWTKPLNYSIFPDGVSNGDIIFAGSKTPYYNLQNINDAPNLSSITATFTQGDTVVTAATSLNSLKTMLVVTGNYNDGSHIDANRGLVTLTGTLAEGTSTITATYNGKTDTFEVTVTAA